MASTKPKSTTEPTSTTKYLIRQLATASENANIMGIKTSILNTEAKAVADAYRRIN